MTLFWKFKNDVMRFGMCPRMCIQSVWSSPPESLRSSAGFKAARDHSRCVSNSAGVIRWCDDGAEERSRKPNERERSGVGVKRREERRRGGEEDMRGSPAAGVWRRWKQTHEETLLHSPMRFPGLPALSRVHTSCLRLQCKIWPPGAGVRNAPPSLVSC